MSERYKCSLWKALESLRKITGCGKEINGKYEDRKCKICKYNPLNK